MVLHSPRRGLLPGKDRCPDTAFPSSPRSGATPRRLQGRPFTPREPRDASRWLETRPAKQKERRKGRAPPQPHPAGRTCLRLLHSPARRRPRDLRPAPPALSRGSSRHAGPSFCLFGSHKIARRGIPPPVPAPLPFKRSLAFLLDRLSSPVMKGTAFVVRRGRRPRPSVLGFEGDARPR